MGARPAGQVEYRPRARSQNPVRRSTRPPGPCALGETGGAGVNTAQGRAVTGAQLSLSPHRDAVDTAFATL